MFRIFAALVGCSLFFSVPAFAAHYKIDPEHSNVGFKIRHLAISSVHGKFVQFNGDIFFDPKKIEDSKTEATIAVSSINTDQKKRDDHLRSAEFFDATNHPEIKFSTTKISEATAEGFKLHGNLTMRGVTKPVVLDVSYQGTAKDPWGNERAAFSATTKLNRRDFGLSWNKVLETGGLVVGDEVTINLEIEGIKQG